MRASLLVLFSYVFLANAWTGDDAQITFRAVWNFVHGYGLTWNPDERVQAFTHPFWTLVISAAYFVTREFFFTVTALSWVFDVAAGIVLLRRARTMPGAVLMVAWLLSSKALIDYSSSGLEYPLSYLLIAIFYVSYLNRPPHAPVRTRELRFSLMIASLGFLNRPDVILLFAFPLAQMTISALRTRGWRDTMPAVLGCWPAVLWLAFATFYYGFPLPNTYYAKVANGVPSFLQHEQGFAYLFNSISHDPITVGTVVLSVLVAWRLGTQARAAALSAALYVVYTVSVGGDFMSGRFFAMPFLVSVATVVPEIDFRIAPWAGGALVLYNLLVPIVPIKTTASYDGAWPWRTQNGIKDERGHTHQGSNLLGYAPFRPMPDSSYSREGLSFGASDQHVAVYCCIGAYGLNAGPTKHIIDENALSDPLLARLPVSPRVYFDFWASHYFRDLPAGYIESTDQDRNLLADPLLHDYYDKLRNVTRGSVFRLSRLADIWALNVNYRNLHEQYEKTRQIAISMPATHARFLTEVGFRDERAMMMRATGRAGLLQYGPGIPLKAGYYRVRWIGTVENPEGTPVGFVEAWDGDHRLERQPVIVGETNKDRKIAQIDFSLPDAARSLEYRFFVTDTARLNIERIELFSGLAIPAETP